MAKSRALYTKGKQIRVFLTTQAYNTLKQESECCFMTLEQYAGLILSGFQVIKPEVVEKSG